MGIKEPTKRKWREILLAQKASRLNATAFCKENNISRTNFYKWRRYLGIVNEPMETSLAAVSGNEIQRSASLTKGFVRLLPPTDKSEAIYIETPNGYQVKIGQVGEEGLKNVLEMLRSL